MPDQAPIECGKEAAKHFYHAQGYRNLNHGETQLRMVCIVLTKRDIGSYGTYPKEIGHVFHGWQEQCESQPDIYIRYQYRTKLLTESRHIVEDYLRAPRDTCVYVQNATTGVDTVLRNLIYQPGDVIVGFSILYESFKYTYEYLTEITPVEYEIIELPDSLSDLDICNAFEERINEIRASGRNPRIAVFDTIASLPAIKFPFERLIGLCRSLGVLSCIDGAHSIGLIDLNLTRLDPDFFSTNCHKWLYVPRGCAVLYTPVRNQHLLRVTLPTGFGWLPHPKDGEPALNNYISNFSDIGSKDDTPYLCIEAALAWRRRVRYGEEAGEGAVMSYIHQLGKDGGEAVRKILGTEILDNAEGTLGGCGFANVRLPIDLNKITDDNSRSAGDVISWIMKRMALDYRIALNISVFKGCWWVRLCAQVYLTLNDFEVAGERLKELCRQVDSGEWLI